MKFSQVVMGGVIGMFGLIGVSALLKHRQPSAGVMDQRPTQQTSSKAPSTPTVVTKEVKERSKGAPTPRLHVDRVRGFFSKESDRFPIVETVTYSSRVPWLQGRPAWIADYAAHYKTSRHFIARSLNSKPDYTTQNVVAGNRFNVLRSDKSIHFHLLVDIKNCLLHFFYVDEGMNETVLVKTYPVSMGKKDDYSPSGVLTPAGKFHLGDRVAIYKPGVMGYFQNQRIEMINVFGTRWMPFHDGNGLHGAPSFYDEETQSIQEMPDKKGDYMSLGCIRLHNADIEELYAIVISRDTVVEIVNDTEGWEPEVPLKYKEDIGAVHVRS